MKKITELLLYLPLVFLACNNPDKGTSARDQTNSSETKQQTGNLNEYLTKYEQPSQTFTVSSSKPTQVKGRKGTVISINPSDLETVDGKEVSKDIQVELKELTNQQELLRANAQTTSNGQLLVSGGAYYINMTSSGRQLKLKAGKSLSVVFSKLTDKEMALFYGQRDSLGQINWQKTNETFTPKQEKEELQPDKAKKTVKKKSESDAIIDYLESGDTTTTEEGREQYAKWQKNYQVKQKVYEAINIQSFGWINCDRFLEAEDKTDFIVKISPSDSIINANVYLVFKEINSVMQQYYFYGADNSNSLNFQGLPVGYKIRIIAYTVKDENAYACASDVTISKNQNIDIGFNRVTEQEFKNLLSR